jgi:Cd2+/Zn2+-exporting ATPase
MNQEHEVALPLPVLGEDEGPRCTDLLQNALRQEPGIRGLEFDIPQRHLRFRFDPDVISFRRVQQLSRRLGAELGQRLDHCSLRLRGVNCAACLEDWEHSLAALPGVHRIHIDPTTESLVVDYDPQGTPLETFEDLIGQVGEPKPRTRAAMKTVHAQESFQRQRMALLTVGCFLAWLVGLVAEWTQWLPTPAIWTVYALAYLTGGLPTAWQALHELRKGSVSINLLMITAALGAAAGGELPEGAFLLFLFSLSNTLEKFVLDRTRHAIGALMDLSPEEGTVRRAGREQKVPVEELQVGDVLVVRPGERIAADGVIQKGQTSVDQSAMTGESMPVEKEIGDGVFAGTLNQQGAIEVQVTRPAHASTLARIVQLVEEAQSEKAQSQRFSDWFGARYTMGVLAAALVIFLVPLLFFNQSFDEAFYRAMTFLVVASPCAVVISIPAAILSAITGAARGGVLFKGGVHLERMATLRAIAFDKTGTLTEGRPHLVGLQPAPGTSADELLQLAAAAESRSEHPLARAVVEAAQARGLALTEASDLQAIVGQGLRAHVGSRPVWVGKEVLFTERGCPIPGDLARTAAEWAGAGKTILFVGDDRAVRGLIAVADTLRASALDAVHELRALGVEHLLMLTGDNQAVARTVADRLGIDFRADLLPEQKVREVRRLRQDFDQVAMVGDGINDAPSLAAANLGISLGGAGTDVALETADVVLMGDDLRRLPHAIALARRTQRIIRENLIFAFGMIGVLLAFTFFGSLRMPLAVIGHEGSTVLVILNGLRLLAFRGRV